MLLVHWQILPFLHKDSEHSARCKSKYFRSYTLMFHDSDAELPRFFPYISHTFRIRTHSLILPKPSISIPGKLLIILKPWQNEANFRASRCHGSPKTLVSYMVSILKSSMIWATTEPGGGWHTLRLPRRRVMSVFDVHSGEKASGQLT